MIPQQQGQDRREELQPLHRVRRGEQDVPGNGGTTGAFNLGGTGSQLFGGRGEAGVARKSDQVMPIMVMMPWHVEPSNDEEREDLSR